MSQSTRPEAGEPDAVDRSLPLGNALRTAREQVLVPRTQLLLGELVVNYEEGGESHAGPTIVLIHGFGATLETWHDIFPLLTQHWHTIRLDLRGSGFSSKPHDDRYSPQDQAEVVLDFIVARRLSSVVLVGHSLGGGIALLSSIRQQQSHLPFRIAGLILIDSAGYPQPLPFFVAVISNPVTRAFVYALPAAMRARLTLDRIFRVRNQVTADRIGRYAFFLDLPGSRHALTSTAKHLAKEEATAASAQIGSLSIPTLVIWGKDDPAIPVASAYRFQSDLRVSTVVVLEDTGHVPHEERPASVIGAMTAFLEGAK